MTRVVLYIRTSLLYLYCLVIGISTAASSAWATEGSFSLQVSPSPLVATIKPGSKDTLELKIRNASTADEQLKIEARSFRYDNTTGTVVLDDTLAPAMVNWITLPEPGFTIKAGEWQTKHIGIDLPADTGFSYSFALIISRNNDSATIANGQLLKGSVAVFTLLNVDRPGAVRSLELTKITTDQALYEFLPTKVQLRLKNTGNTIVRPYGNIYIQRPGDNDHPLATMAVNDAQAYLLPGTERTLEATWEDGFPHYTTSQDASGNASTKLNWDLDQIRNIRFGQYSARAVAVYSDGTRDVPIIGDISFWVIPWRAIVITLAAIIAIVMLLRLYIKKRTEKAVERALAAAQSGNNVQQ